MSKQASLFSFFAKKSAPAATSTAAAPSTSTSPPSSESPAPTTPQRTHKRPAPSDAAPAPCCGASSPRRPSGAGPALATTPPASPAAKRPRTAASEQPPQRSAAPAQPPASSPAPAATGVAGDGMEDEVRRALEGITPEMLDNDFESPRQRQQQARQERQERQARQAVKKEAVVEVPDGDGDDGGDGESSGMDEAEVRRHERYADGYFNTAKRRELHREAVGAPQGDRCPFLRDVRDAAMRRPGEPGYDPSTLHIPSSCWAKMTNFDRQFWQIKSSHFDTIVFFRKGKFYELYESDAEIGQRELGLRLTARQNTRMVGVPAATLMEWTAKLLSRGYKVARVDELPAASASSTSILQRELVRVYTPATLTDESMLSGPAAVYLCAVVELASTPPRYGACVVDAAAAEIRCGEFTDDKARTALETLLVSLRPRELLLAPDGSDNAPSQLTLALVSSVCAGSADVSRRPTAEPDATAKELDGVFGGSAWPAEVRAVRESTLALAAVGMCVSYLRVIKMDAQVLPCARWGPLGSLALQGGAGELTDSLVLDGQTLRNLEVLRNSSGGTEGTLLALLDHTATHFGQRTLVKWLCAPPCDPARIEERHNAVDDLLARPDAAQALRSALNVGGDLERRAARVASQGSLCSASLLLQVLCAFDKWSSALSKRVAPALEGCKSAALRALTTLQGRGGAHPDIEAALAQFREAVELDAEAKYLRPRKGYDAEYDRHMEELVRVRAEMDKFLADMRGLFRTDAVRWAAQQEAAAGADADDDNADDPAASVSRKPPAARHKAKPGKKEVADKRLVLEVPRKALDKRKPPADWSLVNENKTRSQFWTPLAERCARALEDAEAGIRSREQAVMQVLADAFSKCASVWTQAVSCMAQLDCLQSLAAASELLGGDTCRPVFVDAEKEGGPVFDARQLRHPCLCGRILNFVPNDVCLRAGTSLSMLLTGPNMGGKSTLLRQACVAVVLAQLGCRVPAQSLVLSPVDRIFTRIGASDNLVAGQSTFMVELLETASVLRYATRNSLVVLDELGRGTSTYDGYAIAYAVLRHAAESLRCRTMFSTHYHMLTTEFGRCGASGAVGLWHMECLVEDEGSSDAGDDDCKNVVFTYRLCAGTCPRSYGVQVARAAGLPDDVLRRAREAAAEFARGSALAHREHRAACVAALTALAALAQSSNANGGKQDDLDNLLSLWKSLQAESAAVEATGQAQADARARADTAQIEGETAVKQAELKSNVIKADSGLKNLTATQLRHCLALFMKT
eukprot:m51a1_g14256 putative dna mismatch repair protein msh6 (1263) ;mRNA; f:277351-288130